MKILGASIIGRSILSALLAMGGALASVDSVQARLLPEADVAESLVTSPPAPESGRTLGPALDILVVIVLAWVLWSIHRRRDVGHQSSVRDAQYYEREASERDRERERTSVRAVTYPSEAEAKRLGQYREEWVAAFLNQRRGKVSFALVDAADSWHEDAHEFVTVHFQGTLGERPFDEFWTFEREKDQAWIVASVRESGREAS